MTVKSELRRNDYNGDGVTTTFAVSFPFRDAKHLRVVLTDLNGGYTDGVIVGATVSGQGGTVPLDQAPARGVPVAILGATPLTQDADFSAGVSGSVLEAALDKITMQQQEQDETLGRTFRVPPGYPGPDLTLPAPVPGRGLKFDAAGKLVLTQGDMDAQVTGSTAVVHADRVAVGRVNDYRSGNSAVADILQLARSSDFDLTGIVGGTDGKELRVQCTGGGDVTLVHNSTHSSAGNRFWLSPSAYPAGEVKIEQGDTATLLYMRYNAAVGSVWVLTGVTQAQTPEATTSVKGVVEFATQAEARAGIATDKAMTPALVQTIASGGGGVMKKLVPDSQGRVAIPRDKWIQGYSRMDKAAYSWTAAYDLQDSAGNAILMNCEFWNELKNNVQGGHDNTGLRHFLGRATAHETKFMITSTGTIKAFSWVIAQRSFLWFGREHGTVPSGQLYLIKDGTAHSHMDFYEIG